jgi:hypothetical protein
MEDHSERDTSHDEPNDANDRNLATPTVLSNAAVAVSTVAASIPMFTFCVPSTAVDAALPEATITGGKAGTTATEALVVSAPIAEFRVPATTGSVSLPCPEVEVSAPTAAITTSSRGAEVQGHTDTEALPGQTVGCDVHVPTATEALQRGTPRAELNVDTKTAATGETTPKNASDMLPFQAVEREIAEAEVDEPSLSELFRIAPTRKPVSRKLQVHPFLCGYVSLCESRGGMGTLLLFITPLIKFRVSRREVHLLVPDWKRQILH